MKNKNNIDEKFRQEVHAKLLASLNKERKKMRSEGKYPCEGRWLPPGDIKKLQVQMKKFDRTAFWELIILFLFTGGMVYGGHLLMLTLLLPN